jgi:hypothetical protein
MQLEQPTQSKEVITRGALLFAKVMSTAADNKPLVDFVGYGPDARDTKIVFFGQEERCPPSTVEINLVERRKEAFPKDKDEACKVLAAACEEADRPDAAKKYLAAIEPGNVPQWNLAARFAKHFFGVESWEAEYRALGKQNGRTFLAERFPLPRPAWKAHKFDDEGTLTSDHLEVLRRDLIGNLQPGSVIVSYAGRPTDLLGPMVPFAGIRKWSTIAESQNAAEVARCERYPLVVLTVTKPEKGHEATWEQWLGSAVVAVKREVEFVLKQGR